MAAPGLDLGIYRDVMVVLTTAAVIVPLVQRLKVSPILGFLLAGIALGPKGLGTLPAFDWVTINDEKSLAALAELLRDWHVEPRFQRRVNHLAVGRADVRAVRVAGAGIADSASSSGGKAVPAAGAGAAARRQARRKD